MLLFALGGLTLPQFFAPCERVLLGLVGRPLQWALSLAGTPAVAATAEQRARLAELAAELEARVRHADLAGGVETRFPGTEPVWCGVLATGRLGGGGQPAELQLDRSYAELADCEEYVTKGDVLVGRLLQAGRGLAVDDGPADLARVQLLNHPAARPLAASAGLPDGGALRMVVAPAAGVDPAPLRVELWDDPYRAARMERGRLPVHTLALPSVAGEPPAGLWLGRTRIWGYAGDSEQAPLTIGVFVVPPIEPSAMSHVVVWRRSTGRQQFPGAPVVAVERHPATLHELPGADHGRCLVASPDGVPDGAAVVVDGVCVGIARTLAFGLGLLTTFHGSQQRWSLVLLPDDAAGRPRELRVQVLQGRDGEALVECVADTLDGEDQALPPGYVFTGSNGLRCPSGLFLGRLQPHPRQRELATIQTPMGGGERIELVVGGTR